MPKDIIKQLTKQVVKTTSLFKMDGEFEDDRFCRVRIAAMHSGKNLNNSIFSKEVIEAAKDTFANIPILAEVVEKEDKDGNKYLDYTSHAMHLEEDYYDKDELRMIYDERVVGLVPESNDFELVLDEETGNYYVYVTALLLRDYGNYVCDILEQRGGNTEVSMEINVPEISVDAKEQAVVAKKMVACAITLLGADVKPGMAKANAQMFSLDEQDRQTQLIELLSELNAKLDNFNIDKNFRKEEEELKKEFKEVTEDEIKETPSEEVFEESTKKKKKAEDDDSTPVIDDDKEEEKDKDNNSDQNQQQEEQPKQEENPQQETPTQQEEQTQQEETPTQQEEPQQDNGGEENPEEVDYYSVDYSVTVKGEKKNFSVSLKEKLNALTTLVNDTYSETDGAWYDVDVLEDSKTVEFHDWWANKHYRQSYSVKKDVYSLKGDRIETFVSFLSADEKAALEQMKSNYSATVEKLAQYEAEPEKMSILESESYSNIADTEEFKKFKEVEQHFNLSVEEVRQKANDMLLEYAMGHKIEYSANEPEKKQVGMKLFGNPAKKATKGSSRYGGLFSK